MANIVDYLAWRGEFSFDVTPFCEMDAALLATLCYLDFHGIGDGKGWTLSEALRLELLQEDPNSGTFPERKAMFEAMARSNRFAESRMHHFIALTNPEQKMQFSAMCVDLPDGTMCVAFRGTDSTLVGWREDFDMAYRTLVPAQEAAAYYLEQAAKLTLAPLRLTGHSKGGNLAVYAALCATPALQDQIREVWSFDGPGLNRDLSGAEGYRRIRDRVRSYIPQTSIIGLLMEYYEPYTVVESDATGINQHDLLTWQVYGPAFVRRESIDKTAEVIRDTLHDWLENSTPEQRGSFVDTLFQMLDSTKATRLSELSAEKLRSLMAIFGSRKDLDPDARRIFNRLMGQAVSLGFGNVVERVRSRKDEDDENGKDERTGGLTSPPGYDTKDPGSDL